MTLLFIRFYVSVLAVLFLAWWIYGYVSQYRFEADRARVVNEAHHSGLLMVAKRLREVTGAKQLDALAEIQKRFRCPIQLRPIEELTESQRQQLEDPNVSIFIKAKEYADTIAIGIDDLQYLRLGPFPDYMIRSIEDSIAGWITLAAERLDEAQEPDAALGELQNEFRLGVDRHPQTELPETAQERWASGRKVVFYMRPDRRWYASTALANGESFLRFGAFPEFVRVDRPAATTTLGLVLLPAALAIALLLRPVANQLRKVETAAKAIAGGDTSARVDEKQIGSARDLAKAFNHMAARTETMLRTQRELLQAVSHELKTPLARLRFSMDLVESAAEDQLRKQRLASMDAAVEDLHVLVDELISYVRAESVELVLRQEPLGVGELLPGLVATTQSMSPHFNFSIEREGQKDLGCILADRMAFQRAIGNLLSNANRFARTQVVVRAYRRWSVEASASASPGTSASPGCECVWIEIEDDGPGIPAADRERVFEPFVRLDASQQEQQESIAARGGSLGSHHHAGVGLGLAIVHRIVTQHCGTVSIEAGALGGCRVITRWPAVRLADSEAVQSPAHAVEGQKGNGRHG
jgi:two-component system, OmpR family, sensor histidine kinase RstB